MPSSYFESTELNTCQCGHKPTHYEVMYGSTPYAVRCECGKDTTRFRSIGGSPLNIISFWNELAPLKEISLHYDAKARKFGSLVYELNNNGIGLLYKEVRQAILDCFEQGIYKVEVNILLSNGKIKCDANQFMLKHDLY